MNKRIYSFRYASKIVLGSFVLFSSVNTILSINCDCLEPDKLFPISTAEHGAGVRSVSWCCNAACCAGGPFSAIAGLKNKGGTVLRIYNIQKDKLNELTSKTGNHLYSVDWCCIGATSYIAVGGLPDQAHGDAEVHVYKFTDPSLEYITSFTHGVPINSVAWLCGCDQCITGTPLLAIGGQAAQDDMEIRTLIFDPTAKTLTEGGSAIHGAEVFSVDWCCREGRPPILAVGGKNSEIGCEGYNIRVYCTDCETGIMTPITMARYPGELVDVVKWCCDPRIRFPYLAVGGKKHTSITGCINTQVYLLDPPPSNRLVLVSQPGACVGPNDHIFAADWIPGCQCDHLTVGGGCANTEECISNIFVLKRDTCHLPEVTKTKYDINVMSLEWCKTNTCAYLLVGTETTVEEDVCTENLDKKEIILYQGRFCPGIIPPPFPVCIR